MKNSNKNNPIIISRKSDKISLGEKIKNFFRQFFHYFAVILAVCIAIYAIYIIAPEILKLFRNFIVDLMWKDYIKPEQESSNSKSDIKEFLKNLNF